jgi:hypothetical protein
MRADRAIDGNIDRKNRGIKVDAKNQGICVEMLLCNTYSLAMNFFKAIKFSQACLIAFMLLAQSAVAQHSATHAWHDATEYCQVYTNAEASKVLSSPEITFEAGGFRQALRKSTSSHLATFRPLIVYARAPPRTN